MKNDNAIKKVHKKVGLIPVLTFIKEGMSPSLISKKYNIPKQTISYYVGKLVKLGCIENIGYGTWQYIKEVPKVLKGSGDGQELDKSKKEIRGHAFIWKIEFFDPLDWKKVVKKYKKKKLSFQLICRESVNRTVFEQRKIWLTKNGMVIYEPLDFLGKSSFSVKGTAVFEMDQLIKKLFKELGEKFRPYKFTTSREHYAIMKNQLARQYNDQKKKLFVKNAEGTTWLWIDHSHGEHELENAEPKVNRQVQNYWNDLKKHGFKVDASFVLKGMANQNNAILQNTKNLDFHAENMRSHVQATKDLSNATKLLNATLEKQTAILNKILEKQ